MKMIQTQALQEKNMFRGSYYKTTEKIVIKPPSGWISIGLHELWRYRELFYFLAWRDVKVRYKQTVLGIVWAFIQPFISMVVFTVFFGKLAKMPSDGVPYPVFSYAALVPWTFFANSLSQSSGSLVSNSNLIQKVYFPRLIIPSASILCGFIDFGISFTVLLGIMAWYGLYPTIHVLWLPFFIFLVVITALGIGLWLTALNVQFRDVQYAIPFLIQAWMFATPIVYPSSLLSEPWKTLYGINPMVGVVEGFRWALLDIGKAPSDMIFISCLIAITIFYGGIYYFRWLESSFADVF